MIYLLSKNGLEPFVTDVAVVLAGVVPAHTELPFVAFTFTGDSAEVLPLLVVDSIASFALFSVDLSESLNDY
jgi:hypothetical protein